MTDKENPSKTGPADSDSASSPPAISGTSRRLPHMTLILILTAAAFVWLLYSTLAVEKTPRPGAEIGETAPDFTLELFDGTTFTLTQHLTDDKRPVVMNFWASWCIPCREEMPAFDAVARQRPDILIIGVAAPDVEILAREFADEIAVTYPLGLDREGSIFERYPIVFLPATWFITSDGTIVEQRFGQLDEGLLGELIDRHLTG